MVSVLDWDPGSRGEETTSRSTVVMPGRWGNRYNLLYFDGMGEMSPGRPKDMWCALGQEVRLVKVGHVCHASVKVWLWKRSPWGYPGPCGVGATNFRREVMLSPWCFVVCRARR